MQADTLRQTKRNTRWQNSLGGLRARKGKVGERERPKRYCCKPLRGGVLDKERAEGACSSGLTWLFRATEEKIFKCKQFVIRKAGECSQESHFRAAEIKNGCAVQRAESGRGGLQTRLTRPSRHAG